MWSHRYGCTFAEPGTGWSLSLLADGIDTQVMRWVLRELKATLSEGEEAWVVLDRAGWHISPKVEVPEGVRLIFLPPGEQRTKSVCPEGDRPPYSPELQPAERVWPLVNDAFLSPRSGVAVANRYFPTLREMMEGVAERCRVLEADPQTLRRHTLFHWWPRAKASA